MNYIGFAVPKIASLTTVLVSDISFDEKLILAGIWFFKLAVDYDAIKPGHRGIIYKLTRKSSFEVGELIAACVGFIPALIFVSAAIGMKAWIPFFTGVIAIIVCVASIVSCIKELIDEKQRKDKQRDRL